MLASASRSFLSAVLAFASLATVACSAPTSEDATDASPDDAPVATAEGDEGLALSGSASLRGPSHAQPALLAANSTNGASDVVGVLELKDTGAFYDVLSVDLAFTGASTTSLTGGASALKPVIAPVQLRLRPRANAKLLGAAALGGAKPFRTAIITLLDPTNAKVAPFATLEYALVTRASTASTDAGTVEELELTVRAAVLEKGAVKIRIDTAAGTAACVDPTNCPCGSGGTATNLGPYTQTMMASWPIAEGATRIDDVTVQVAKKTSTVAGTADVATSSTVLEELSFGGRIDPSGVCAALQATSGSHAKSLVLDVASPLSDSLAKPVTETRWEACIPSAKEVRFTVDAGRNDQRVSIGAAGLVRTDFTYDLFGGKELSKTVSGWSFAKNMSITTCANVF